MWFTFARRTLILGEGSLKQQSRSVPGDHIAYPSRHTLPAHPPATKEPSPVVKTDAIVKCRGKHEKNPIIILSQIIGTVPLKPWQFLMVQSHTMSNYKILPSSHKYSQESEIQANL